MIAVLALPPVSRFSELGEAVRAKSGVFGLTVNGIVLELPPGVVTEMSYGPGAAEGSMLNVPLITTDVTDKLLTRIPLDGFTVIEAPSRLAPLILTGTEVPCVPEVGFIENSDGGGGMMLKGRELDVAPAAVIDTDSGPAATERSTVTMAVI